MDWEHLAGSWSSTPIALEGMTFQCKDVVCCVDDWLLQGSRSDHEQAQRSAGYLIRAAANQAGRQRSNRDGTPNVGRPPRGPILMTGEATPDGHSVNARLIRLLVTSGLLAPSVKPILDRCQADADAGLYAAAMAGYIQYVVGRYEQLQHEMKERVAHFRDNLRTKWKCGHPRTATILAKLMAAFEVFLEFALWAGAIDEDRLNDLFDRQGEVLVKLARRHSLHLQTKDPFDQFIELLSGAILSELAYLESRLGGPPTDEDPRAWGWRGETYLVPKKKVEEINDGSAGSEATPPILGGSSAHPPEEATSESKVEYVEQTRWRPQGLRVGWILNGTVYLQGGPALAVAQTLGNKFGVHLALTEQTLGRAAFERNVLLESDIGAGRGKYTHRAAILGKRPPVYIMKASTILADASTFGAFEDMDEDEAQQTKEGLLAPYEAARRQHAERLEA